jgi:hypothetical protein
MYFKKIQKTIVQYSPSGTSGEVPFLSRRIRHYSSQIIKVIDRSLTFNDLASPKSRSLSPSPVYWRFKPLAPSPSAGSPNSCADLLVLFRSLRPSPGLLALVPAS